MKTKSHHIFSEQESIKCYTYLHYKLWDVFILLRSENLNMAPSLCSLAEHAFEPTVQNKQTQEHSSMLNSRDMLARVKTTITCFGPLPSVA